MTVDVDAVNERLNGLVNLLHVVGIDAVDAGNLQSDNKDGAVPQSNDAQLLEIIKKLQQAQADSPEILAALKSPELRALASLAAAKPVTRQAEPEKKPPPPSLGDVMEDDDDNYPKIGPGYSDDISVVSDLTTPTVMTKQHVQEEEYYKDVNGGPGALPPMNIALGPGPALPARPNPGLPRAYVAPPKTKNLVSQVRPAATRRAIAKSGGAAAQRRLNYQQAMAKLQSTDTAAKTEKSSMDFTPQKANKFVPSAPTPTADPSEFPSIAEFGKKTSRAPKKTAVPQPKSRGNSKKTSLASQDVQDISFGDTGVSSSSKKKSSGKSGDLDWGNGSNGAWPAFDDKQTKKKKDKSGFDNDGFFSGDAFANSDPFATTSSSKSPSKKSSSDPFNVGGDAQASSSSKSRHKRDEKSSDRKGSKSKSSKSKSRPRTNLAM